ncbi:nicotinate phosphoribosyltransferase [Corallincola holothuriorum]|uniref:Nicotinate phosphoribosyltransferase n=1 Tax=Corallincola holothuriorum TaxID=2282215 RepID=A0A368NH86_9GAMM|nr:nicotinate phosphoribosyltransferase [Corallincola holothuriorum]RCU48751.1 nicotinate phosphoribosyltransferase [Corallincola holothuriorum]
MFGRTSVQSMLDTDFYKLTMGQAYLHQIPGAEAEWEFKCRTDEDLTPYVSLLRAELEGLSELYLTDDQYNYLASNFSFLSPDYLRWLQLFRYDPSLLSLNAVNGQLQVTARGPQLHVSPFEIPLMACLSEIRNRQRYPEVDSDLIRKSTYTKIKQLEALGDKCDLSDFRFADFGTRRRFSFSAQKQVVDMLTQQLPQNFVGTSNPLLAREFGVSCIGTMAHEWFQTHQQLNYRLVDSQRAALDNWVTEYRGDLGVALTDIIGVDSFCNDLDLYFAKLYDGYRHDSGDPILWGDKIIARLEALKVDPSQKTLVFSDGLNFEKAVAIYSHFQGRIKTSFGIGTWLMGDFGVNKPMNMVMKMVRLNGHPVAKISDSPGKTMCRDRSFLEYLMNTFAVDMDVRTKVLANI